jgi:hypothetical protein
MGGKKSAVTGKGIAKNILIFLILKHRMALYCTSKPISSKKDKKYGRQQIKNNYFLRKFMKKQHRLSHSLKGPCSPGHLAF